MTTALSRKRSRLGLDSDDEAQQRNEHTAAPTSFSDGLKKTKTQCELDALSVIRPEDAWSVDVDAVMASNRIAVPPGSGLATHDNWARYNRDNSIMLYCVQGNVQTHYELLCSALPDLYLISPSLQACVLCYDPTTHRISPDAPFSLPLIQGVTPANNHFVRLGLLHPLGGGKHPLDALVVVDPQGRRRLVLPFGWGAGKFASTPAGQNIRVRLMGLLKECIQTLELER